MNECSFIHNCGNAAVHQITRLKNRTKSMHNKEEPLCASAQCTCKYMTGEQSGSDEVRRDLVRF